MTHEDEKSIFLQQLAIDDDTSSSNPLPTPKSEPPKKQHEKKKPRKKTSGTAIFATTFLLFLVVVTFLIFVMTVGGTGNPVLQFFGQEESQVKNFLLSVVNGSFGFLSVIVLLSFTVALFLGFSRPKGKKGGSFVLSVVSFFLLFLTVLVWLGMYKYVDAIIAAPGKTGGSISMTFLTKRGKKVTMLAPIKNEDTAHFVAPIAIEFSADDIVKKNGGDNKNIRITGYEWEFNNDGNIITGDLSGENTHLFRNKGRKTVTVTVSAERKNNPSKDLPSIVKNLSFEIPKASFTATPDRGAIPLTVEFDATGLTRDMGNIDSLEWDFDGDFVYEQKSVGPKISHTFEKIGRYPIRLRIVDRNGSVAEYSREVETVHGEDAVVVARISTFPALSEKEKDILRISTAEKVVFTAEDSSSNAGKIQKYEWNFLEGTKKLPGKSMTYTFLKPGEYPVNLTVTDENKNTATSMITVIVTQDSRAPVAVITTTPAFNKKKELSGTDPFRVEFDASQSSDDNNNILSYEWDFDGDQKIDATGSIISHTFRAAGDYRVRLVITDADGYVSKSDVAVRVMKKEFAVVIVTSSDTVEVPCRIDFDGSLSTCREEDCRISSYEWDFGDGLGPQIGGAHVQHYFSEVGQYTVKLTAHSRNKSYETTRNVFCQVPPVRACFTASRSRGAAPLRVSFDPSCSKGTIQKWAWDFGDGKLSEKAAVDHIFETSGTHTVTLSVIDERNNVAEYNLDIEVQ